MPPLEEYVDEIRDMWDTHWLTNMGPKHQKLQQELKSYLDVDNIELLTNGHMSLELSLQALKLKGEVITTPYTFASTTHAIVRNGLTPVFCDIDPHDFTIDTEKIESLITDNTCAIMPVHVYGNVCHVEEIDRIAKKYGLRVIYDAAHTFGERYKGRSVATFGDVSCYSFHATKVFNTIEGGGVCYGDDMKEFGEALYNLKNFGIHGPETVEAVGANAKMNEFCAAMGLCSLRHIDEEISKRKTVFERYCSNLEEIPGLHINHYDTNIIPNYVYFPIVIEPTEFGATRNEIFDALAANNIGARKYFYPITNTFDCYIDRYECGETPIALAISKRVLTLPMYADLAMEDVDRISEIVRSCRK